MKLFSTLLLMLFVAISGTLSSQVVTNGLDDGSMGSLRQQVLMASDGATITFDVTVILVSLNSEIEIDKNLTITGTPIANTQIDAGTNGRIFNVTAGEVVLQNLLLTNGIAENGGAIYNSSTLTLNDCIISDCEANGMPGSGGAIFNDAAAMLTATNCTMTGNSATRAGGAIEDNSGEGLGIVLNLVSLSNNETASAPGNGGGLHITGAGNSMLTDCFITGNSASAEGGGLWNGTGTMNVSGTLISENTTVGDGADQGGAGIFNAGGTLIVDDCMITDNATSGTSTSGGGILNDLGILTVSDTEISGNSSVRAGGGIEDNSAVENVLTLTNVSLLNNATASAPGNGGGLHITGPGNSTIMDCTVTGNSASAEGGGLWNGSGTMTVTNTTIFENTVVGDGADQGGAGIFNAGGNLNVVACTIESNVTSGAATSGGGILNDMGILTVSDTEISDNFALRAGGGIEDNSAAGNILTLTNVTLFENATASAPGNGGGLHITGPGNSTIMDCTITGNTASAEGGGLWNGAGTMTLSGTTINENTTVGDGADQGGAGVFNAGGTINVDDCMITDNTTSGTSTSGGGILNDLGVLSVTNSEISGNSSVRAGGGIEDNSAAGNTLTLTGVTFMNNATASAPGNGGGLHITGPGNSTIMDCTVTGNSASAEGGGLWNGAGTMTLSGTTISENTTVGDGADQGGAGVFNAGGTVNVDDCMITDNETTGVSTSGGGILNDLGILSVSNTVISGNTSVRAGGGIEDNSVAGNMLTLTAVSLLNNATGTAPGNGGGLHITGPGNSTITDCTVTGNSAFSEGGGLWNGSGLMIVSATDVMDNEASGADADHGGGGIFNNGGDLTINGDSQISNNSAIGTAGSGGGLLSTAGTVSIVNCVFAGNSANRAGGAIELIDGDLTFENSTMENNDVNGSAGDPAPGNGGGFHVTGNSGMVSFSNSIFSGNEAGREGGAIWNQSGTTMVISDCHIDGNTSEGAMETNGGAGVFNNSGILEINNSTLSNNTDMGAAAAGGGVHNKEDGTVEITTSTLSGNSSATGGGIYNNGTSFTVDASTIAFNSASTIGGGVESATAIDFKNTIVSDNTAPSGSDLSGASITTSGYNLIATDDLNVFAPAMGDVEGEDPLLTAMLTDNAGGTPTHKLLPNSPAYNAGDPADLFVDQNGQAVFQTIRDMGADEAQEILISVENIYAAVQVDIYPNPAQAQTNIVVPKGFGSNTQITLRSATTGQLLMQSAVQSGLQTLDLSQYPTGIYIVQLQSDQSLSSVRVSKIK